MDRFRKLLRIYGQRPDLSRDRRERLQPVLGDNRSLWSRLGSDGLDKIAGILRMV